MKFTGKIQNIVKDWATGQFHITFTVNEASAIAEIDKIKDVEKLSIEAKKYREKRSLDANAYYWQLVTQIAEAINSSISFVHNYLLRKYGQVLIIDDKMAFVVLPDTDEASRKADEADTFHVKPTSQVKVGKDGKTYRTYIMLRGSSDCNTYEMSKLIDGCVSEAKYLGIETLTPDELERMKASCQTNTPQNT